MKKVMNYLKLLLVTALFIGIISDVLVSAKEEADFSITKIDSQLGVEGSDYDVDIGPKLQINKDGSYTVTVFESSYDIPFVFKKSVKGYVVRVDETGKNVELGNNNEPFYFNHEGRTEELVIYKLTGDSKTYKKTISLRLLSNGKLYGSVIKLNIIIKALPETSQEIALREIKEELNMEQLENDFEKVKAAYEWIQQNLYSDARIEKFGRLGLSCIAEAKLFNSLLNSVDVENYRVVRDDMQVFYLVKVNKKWYFIKQNFFYADNTDDEHRMITIYPYFLKGKNTVLSNNHKLIAIDNPTVNIKKIESEDYKYPKDFWKICAETNLTQIKNYEYDSTGALSLSEWLQEKYGADSEKAFIEKYAEEIRKRSQ